MPEAIRDRLPSRLSSQQVPLSAYDRQPKLNGKRDSELTQCGVTGHLAAAADQVAPVDPVVDLVRGQAEEKA